MVSALEKMTAERDELDEHIAVLSQQIRQHEQERAVKSARRDGIATSIDLLTLERDETPPLPDPPKAREPRINVRSASYNLLQQRGAMTAVQIGGHLNRPAAAVRRSLEAVVLAGKITLKGELYGLPESPAQPQNGSAIIPGLQA